MPSEVCEGSGRTAAIVMVHASFPNLANGECPICRRRWRVGADDLLERHPVDGVRFMRREYREDPVPGAAG